MRINKKYYVLGTDLSHHNDIDLTDCGNQGFIMLKATEGRSVIDNKCMDYIKQMTDHVNYRGGSMPFIGFYHYAHPEFNTALTEAYFFLNNIRPHIGGCMCVLDYEDKALSVPQSEKWALEWLNYVRDKAQTNPIFYVQASALKNYPTIAQNFPLWIACYSQESRQEKYKKEIEKADFIQVTSHPLDINIFMGDMQDMCNIIKGV